jgi:hypothetical protein
MTGGAMLHAVRHPGDVTAAAALAWFATGSDAAGDGELIGYLLAPDRAEWFRCAEGVPHGPGGLLELGDAFEVFATTGHSQLRWVHQRSGTGPAVSLAEDAAGLPPGDPVREPAATAGTLAGELRRLGGVAARMLAGQVTVAGSGWATLVTARYSPCQVPVVAQEGQEVWAEMAEYAATDDHGNVSVADTLLLRLAARNALAKERPE